MPQYSQTRVTVPLVPPCWMKDSTHTLELTIDLSLRRQPKQSKSPKTRRNPVSLAREWRQMMEEGECSTQLDISKETGFTTADVSRYMRVLKLDPKVQDKIVSLGDPIPCGLGISKYSLEELVELVP